jgi:hypothetical protein
MNVLTAPGDRRLPAPRIVELYRRVDELIATFRKLRAARTRANQPPSRAGRGDLPDLAGAGKSGGKPGGEANPADQR